tara:strand:+ start:760 stop:1401 length:642 start_codon:yes stop_codon:yes gene_type:complete
MAGMMDGTIAGGNFGGEGMAAAGGGYAAFIPAAFTILKSINGTQANNAQFAGQMAAAQQGQQVAAFGRDQKYQYAGQIEAVGQRANLDVQRTADYLLSSQAAKIGESATYGADLAVQRARIIAEAAYQGQQKQWGYQEQARQARLKGDLDVWTADSRAQQIASSKGSVDMANMGLLAGAGATLFEKYNTFGSKGAGPDASVFGKDPSSFWELT